MIRPEVVEYLRQNLQKFPVATLRNQLKSEGISDLDFEHSLAVAMQNNSPEQNIKSPPNKKIKALLGFVVFLIFILSAVLILKKQPASDSSSAETPSSSTGSAYVGAHGWVVHLPNDYVGISQFKDSSKNEEIVHFCKRGTDRTNFINEGLFGQLGIIRLTVAPTPFPANAAGISSLINTVSTRLTARGEKFTLKNIQVSTISGIQVNITSPFPRLEAYLLGPKDIYFFYAGIEDELWRDIVLSLRDTHSEN